jgi:hypothetical protein
MLVISRQQMDDFERLALARAQRRVEMAVSHVFADLQPQRDAPAAMSAGELALIVERGIESAVDRGLTTWADWTCYVTLGLALRRRGQDRTPAWLAEELNRAELPGPARMALVEHLLLEAARDDPGLIPVCQALARAGEETRAWDSSTR